MQLLRLFHSCCLLSLAPMVIGCSSNAKKASPSDDHAQQNVAPVFHVDPLTAGSISGTIRYTGQKPSRKMIDMSEDPACVEAHRGKTLDQSLVVSPKGSLANAFIYVKDGLQGKRFETPTTSRMGAGSGRGFLAFRQIKFWR